MSADIQAFETFLPHAIRRFWRTRGAAAKAQATRGGSDQGNRANVTSGKNLDAFAEMVRRLAVDNGIGRADVILDGRLRLTILGYFRPTKNWDLLIVSSGRLLAAIEFKSQVGPSFGNNFNNRVEESLGNATDLLTAYREGAFGDAPRPFLGFFFVLEDCPASTRPVGFTSAHFPALPEFEQTSYAQRYDILCRKLVQESLYDAATVLLTPRRAIRTGAYRCLSDLASPRRFAATLAGHLSGMAAM